MDTDKVIQDLNRRFAAPLPEFYQRRIIFWYDEDKEFEDKLDEVVLENAKVIALTGNNSFSVKKLLTVDDLTTNYLVYSPCVYNRPDDNWLLDVDGACIESGHAKTGQELSCLFQCERPPFENQHTE